MTPETVAHDDVVLADGERIVTLSQLEGRCSPRCADCARQLAQTKPEPGQLPWGCNRFIWPSGRELPRRY
jgi:hypothetical protein